MKHNQRKVINKNMQNVQEKALKTCVFVLFNFHLSLLFSLTLITSPPGRVLPQLLGDGVEYAPDAADGAPPDGRAGVVGLHRLAPAHVVVRVGDQVDVDTGVWERESVVVVGAFDYNSCKRTVRWKSCVPYKWHEQKII